MKKYKPVNCRTTYGMVFLLVTTIFDIIEFFLNFSFQIAQLTADEYDYV